jgi:hypothetical protein
VIRRPSLFVGLRLDLNAYEALTRHGEMEPAPERPGRLASVPDGT